MNTTREGQTTLFQQHPLRGVGKNDFEGSDYDAKKDKARLTGQILRVWNCMKDGHPRTLQQIKAVTGDPESSISAQLRHLRKDKWGGHEVEKKRGFGGTWMYRIKTQKVIECGVCWGGGEIDINEDMETIECPNCKGTGKLKTRKG